MRKDKIECTKCKSTKCFVKQYCSIEWQNKISISKTQNRYKNGEYIFKESAPMFGIYFIQTGGVIIISTLLNGRQQVVRIVTDGDILGHKAIERDIYYFNAITLMDTEVCFMESDMFRDTCMNNPAFAYNIILFYALEFRRTELRVKYQAKMNIREKVAEAFVYFNDVFGINSQTKTLNIELSRQNIASVAGTTAEQVTRQLSDFENEKLISRKKRAIQIQNIAGLKHIVRDYKVE